MVLKVSSKKANAVIDTGVIFVIVAAMSIISIFGYQVFTAVNDEIQSDASIPTNAKLVSEGLHDKYVPVIDGLIMFAFILLVIFTIVSVFLLDTHPIFFVITVLLLIGMFIALIEVGNAYDDIMHDAEISAYANQFTNTTWIMQHVAPLSIGVGFIVAITLFIKFKT